MILRKSILSLMIVLASSLLLFGGIENQVRSVAVPREQIPILMYHKVSPSLFESGRGLRVTPAAFQQQMKFLHERGFHTISLDQMMDHWQKKRGLPSRPIVITFDDGYEDNYRYAFPILRKFGFTATIFLVYEKIGGYNAWDVTQKKASPVDLLSWRQIGIMKDEGITFESHTLTHPDLTRTKLNEARRQIVESKKKLEQCLGTEVNFFAYPYGRRNPAIDEAVRVAGYRGAVTTVQGKNTETADPVELKRLRVNGYTTMEGFKKMVEN